jgi:hypothetical protein
MHEPRERVPHFVVRTIDGQSVDYRTIWQQQSLLLICLDDSDASRPLSAVAEALALRGTDIANAGGVLVLTRDVVSSAPRPGAVIADRWGDIYAAIDATAVKDADDLIEWLRFLQRKCT